MIRQKLTHRLNMAVGARARSDRRNWALARCLARWGLHWRFQPALGHSIDFCCFGRGKCFVKAKDTAVAAFLPSALQCEGCLETTTIGLVWWGRNEVLAHSNRREWNLVQSEGRSERPAWAFDNSIGCCSTANGATNFAEISCSRSLWTQAGTEVRLFSVTFNTFHYKVFLYKVEILLFLVFCLSF